MNMYNSKKLAYSLLAAFIIFTMIIFIATYNKSMVYSIIGMVSAILILGLGRLRENSRKLLLLTIILTIIFAFFGPENLKYSSIIILLAIFPSLKIRNMKKQNDLTFNKIKDNLELKHKKLSRNRTKSKNKTTALSDEIDRYAKLYELSKEIEEVSSSEELAEKSLESLNLKINVEKLAFYKTVSSRYKILQTKNVDEKTANNWLENLQQINNKSGNNLFKFYLKAGKKKLGVIICQGKLNKKQIKEAEVLINQINLGYEKTILYEKVKELSRVDGLTGLYLRKHFLDRLTEELKRSKREGYKTAFIMADLDNFKKYNDTYGHPMGDKLLRKISGIIKNNIYSSDFAGRYGGEEFCIYMSMAESKGTLKKADKIRKLIEKNSPLTISIGISYYPDNGITPEELIKASDTALYRAKEQGRNQIFQL